MTPTEKLAKCREMWREAIEHKIKSERLVLELMRHPDATPEQLQSCRRVMLSIEDLMRQIVTGLRKVMPPKRSAYLTQHAWWDKEYNRYEVKK